MWVWVCGCVLAGKPDLFKVARIRQIFLKYDKDGNEKLDHEEIKQVFKVRE